MTFEEASQLYIQTLQDAPDTKFTVDGKEKTLGDINQVNARRANVINKTGNNDRYLETVRKSKNLMSQNYDTLDDFVKANYDVYTGSKDPRIIRNIRKIQSVDVISDSAGSKMHQNALNKAQSYVEEATQQAKDAKPGIANIFRAKKAKQEKQEIYEDAKDNLDSANEEKAYQENVSTSYKNYRKENIIKRARERFKVCNENAKIVGSQAEEAKQFFLNRHIVRNGDYKDIEESFSKNNTAPVAPDASQYNTKNKKEKKAFAEANKQYQEAVNTFQEAKNKFFTDEIKARKEKGLALDFNKTRQQAIENLEKKAREKRTETGIDQKITKRHITHEQLKLMSEETGLNKAETKNLYRVLQKEEEAKQWADKAKITRSRLEPYDDSQVKDASGKITKEKDFKAFASRKAGSSGIKKAAEGGWKGKAAIFGGVAAAALATVGIGSMMMSGGRQSNSNLYNPYQAMY